MAQQKKKQEEKDPTLHPHLHSYCPEKRGDSESCFWCGEQRSEHKLAVEIVNGVRTLVRA